MAARSSAATGCKELARAVGGSHPPSSLLQALSIAASDLQVGWAPRKAACCARRVKGAHHGHNHAHLLHPMLTAMYVCVLSFRDILQGAPAVQAFCPSPAPCPGRASGLLTDLHAAV